MKPLLNSTDVATTLNCSATTVKRLRRNDPDFPAPILIGGANRWFESEIYNYVLAKKGPIALLPAWKERHLLRKASKRYTSDSQRPGPRGLRLTPGERRQLTEEHVAA